MRRLSTVLPALPLMAGALASAFIFANGGVWSVVCGIIVIIVGVVASLGNMSRGMLFMSIGLVGATVSSIMLAPASAPCIGTDVGLQATVAAVSEGRSGIRAIVEVHGIDAAGCEPFRCRIISDQALQLLPGDIIEVHGNMQSCDKFADIPYMSVSALVDRADRVSAVMIVGSDNVKLIGRDNAWHYRLAALRNDLADAVYASGLSADASSLFVAATLGTGDAAVGIKDRFRATGLSHLLCVSGFHVAIVAWLLSLLLWPMKVWSRAGRLRYIVLIAGVWLFAVFTGAQPSAVRAAIMISAFFTGRLLQRTASPFNSLVLAVGLMLVFNPYWLYSIGFQLSVSAVLGLLVFATKLNPVPMHYNRLYWVANIFTVPLAAMIGTAPVVLFWFHRLPLMSVPVNALAALVFPLFLMISASALIFSWSWLADLADAVCRFIMRLCDSAVSIDGSVLEGIYLSPLSFVGLFAALAFLGLAVHLSASRRPLFIAAVASMFLCAIPLQRADAEVIAMGDSRGSHILLRQGSDCNLLSSRGKIPVDISDYMSVHHVDTLINHDEPYCIISQHKIGLACSKTDLGERVDILLIDGSYRGNISSLIDAHNPRLVIIGANVDSSNAAAIETHCRLKNIKTHPLAQKALLIRGESW